MPDENKLATVLPRDCGTEFMINDMNDLSTKFVLSLKRKVYLKNKAFYHQSFEHRPLSSFSKQHMFAHGRRKDFSRGSNSGEISFYQLETKRKYFSYKVLIRECQFQNPGGPSTSETPCRRAYTRIGAITNRFIKSFCLYIWKQLLWNEGEC